MAAPNPCCGQFVQTFDLLHVERRQQFWRWFAAPRLPRAADLRARYNLTLPDAFQVATALATGCDTLLTNDLVFKRVTELTILILDELEV